jgi:hypothetical protein
MSEQSTPVLGNNSWVWRLIIYLTVWLSAAAVIATQAELASDCNGVYPAARWQLFLEAPFWVSVGLGAITGLPGLMGWLILVLFLVHALATFSSRRWSIFIAHMMALLIVVAVGVVFFLALCKVDASGGG